MINQNMVNAINEQINKEMFSSYLYLSMSAYFDGIGLSGAAHWMSLQSKEENEHAMKLYGHLSDRGGKIALKAIEAPQSEWKSPMDAFKAVLEHEQFITKSINDLYAVAVKENDLPVQILLHWFIEEQVEEEKNAIDVIESMKRIEAHETAVLQLDHQLGKRA